MLSYYQKKGEPTPLEHVKDEKARGKILEAAQAIEMHMAPRYQRTPSRGRVSEAALYALFSKTFFRLLGQKPELCITQIIQGRQEEPEEQWDSLVS